MKALRERVEVLEKKFAELDEGTVKIGVKKPMSIPGVFQPKDVYAS